MDRLILFTICLLQQTLYAQEPQFLWAENIGGVAENTIDEINAVKYDVDGNIYATGYYTGTVDFDPGPEEFLQTATDDLADGIPGKDSFIQKLDPDGNLIWVRFISGAMGHEITYDLDVNTDGTVGIIGTYTGTIDIHPGDEVINITSEGEEDVFLLVLNSDGHYLWSESIGGSEEDELGSITFNNESELYVTLSYENELELESMDGPVTLTSAGNLDLVILKYTELGELLWAKSISGSSKIYQSFIETDDLGNIFLTGAFFMTADFDPSDEVFTLTAGGASSVFSSKLDADGNLLWVKKTTGTSNEFCLGSTLDNLENLYVIGTFIGTVDFDPGIDEYNLTTNGGHDYFIQKYDTDGTFLWVKRCGGASYDQARAIAADDENNIYISGYFTGLVDFDPGVDELYMVTEYIDGPYTSGFNTALFMQKLDDSGNLIWAKQTTLSDLVYVNSIDLYSEEICIGGRYWSFADFDLGGEVELLTSGDPDPNAFIIKYAQCASSGPVTTMDACTEFFWEEDENTYTTSGSYYAIYDNIAGCDSTIQLNLTLINDNMDLILADHTLTVVEEGDSYQWVDCNDDYAIIIDETNASFIPTIDGSYAVIKTTGPCQDTSDCYEVITSSLKENEKGISMNVYPNPFTTNTTIALENPNSLPFTLTLIDITGQEVKRFNNYSENEMILNGEQLNAGIYFLQLIISSENNTTISTLKLIVQ